MKNRKGLLFAVYDLQLICEIFLFVVLGLQVGFIVLLRELVRKIPQVGRRVMCYE
jgi:hypothetical protein